MRLCVIGAGYVGLVTAACFAEMGNQVRCVERDRERVARLRRGEMPIYEPGLESILRDQLDAARLTFTASLAEGLADAEVVFIAVGTPCGEDGSADLSHVLAVAEQLGAQLRQHVDAAAPRHGQVHDQHLNVLLVHQVDGLASVGGLAHHAQVHMLGQKLAQPRAHNRMVVHDTYIDHRIGSPCAPPATATAAFDPLS